MARRPQAAALVPLVLAALAAARTDPSCLGPSVLCPAPWPQVSRTKLLLTRRRLLQAVCLAQQARPHGPAAQWPLAASLQQRCLLVDRLTAVQPQAAAWLWPQSWQQVAWLAQGQRPRQAPFWWREGRA